MTLSNAVWHELRELTLTRFPLDRKTALPWENLPVPAPPGALHTEQELKDLLTKEDALYSDPLRRAEILDQVSSAQITEVLRPLGISDPSEAPRTMNLIQTVVDITERVGYVYKRKFSRLRPNQVAPWLRPFLGNPAHLSYPSNHSFQMFSVAEVMTRLLPELPGTTELFYVAQRVGENREMAGIHYASDSYVGRELARMFSPYLVYSCRHLMRDALQEWS